MAVSKRLRYEVLRRDGHTCKYCGGTAPDVALTVDHVVPVTLGGSDDPANLVAACKDCNAGKSATNPDAPLVADVDAKAAQWAQAMNRVVQERMAELGAERTRIATFDQKWCSWSDGAGDELPREGNWKSSISLFLANGLDEEFLADAVDTAAGNRKIRYTDVWRYFCGICWRELDTIRERTTSSVASTPPTTAPAADAGRKHLHVNYDSLNLVDYWLTGLGMILGDASEGTERALIDLLSDRMWAAMSGAYAVFRKDPEAGPASDRDDVQEFIRDTFDGYVDRIRELVSKPETTESWSIIPSFYEHYVSQVGSRYGVNDDDLTDALWNMPAAIEAAVDAMSDEDGVPRGDTAAALYALGCEAIDTVIAEKLRAASAAGEVTV